MTKTIDIYHRGEIVAATLVDDADYERLSGYRWYLNRGYVVRWESERRDDGSYKTINVLMHRDLTGCPDGMQVDHINHDRLDNRRSNLRIVTNAQNHQNRRRNPSRGAVHDKGKWAAVCKINGVRHRAGRYETREEAAAAAAVLRSQLMPFATD